MWSKKIVEWAENGTAFISVPFTWLLPEAYQRAVWLNCQGYHVRAGGPAVSLMPDYLAGVAEVGGEVEALPRHNPNATFTSRGCPRRCSFCAVPQIEGDLVELDDWETKSIVCDNNLLAYSQKHFDTVIDALKPVRGVDFNQGLDARLLTGYHTDRLAELDLAKVRLAWDRINAETAVMAAIDKIRKAGVPKSKITVYILIGFRDGPEDALYRLETIRSIGILPFAMRFQPLDSLQKNSYVGKNWTDRELRDFSRYWNRQRFFRNIPFAEFKHDDVRPGLRRAT